MPLIREIAAQPWADDLFVGAEFERTAHVWSVSPATLVATVGTVFEFGGRRLTMLGGDTPTVIAGAWARHGVCCYSLTGELLWQNKARSNVQHVTALSSGRVAVGYARGPAAVLDVATGEELRRLRGVTSVIALTPGMFLLESNFYVRLADADLEPMGTRITTASLGVSDAAAGDGLVAVCEPGGRLRILDLDGGERAAYAVPGGGVSRVARDRATGTWRGLVEYSGGDRLRDEYIRLSDDGEVLERRPLGSVLDAAWIQDGGALVFSTMAGVFVLDGEGTVRSLGPGWTR